MKLPKKVRIVGKTYKIVAKKKLRLYGHCSNHRMKIKVETRNAREQVQDTLLHEILHALSFNLKLKLKERQVHPLAAGLLQVLWDNPKVARYLRK